MKTRAKSFCGAIFPLDHNTIIRALCQLIAGKMKKSLTNQWFSATLYEVFKKVTKVTIRRIHCLGEGNFGDPFLKGRHGGGRFTRASAGMEQRRDSMLCPFLKTMEVQVSCLKEARKPCPARCG